MALEKYFETIINQAVVPSTPEEVISDMEDRCARVYSVCGNTIHFYPGLMVEHFRGGTTVLCANELRAILVNIDRFPNLRELALKNEEAGIDLHKLPASLESASIYGKRNLAPLNDLPNLKALGVLSKEADLAQFPDLCGRLRSLSFISARDEAQIGNFSDLEMMTCGTMREGCSPIGKLKKLRGLFIEDFQPENLDGLEGCEALKNLRIQTKALTNISALAQMKSLRCLTLIDANHVSDISSLAGLPLEILEINGCSATDFSPLADMRNLKRLTLNDCLIDDLTPLEALENLEEIDLRGAVGIHLQNGHFFSPLEKLPKLRKVTVDLCAETIFSPELREKLGLRPMAIPDRAGPQSPLGDADIDQLLEELN